MELNREQLIEKLIQNDSCYAEDIKAIKEAIALIRYDEEKIKELTEGKYDIECSYNSLKKDNERLHASCTELERKCASLNDENESLKDSNEHLAVFLAEAKADTVQKMQERLKHRLCCIAQFHFNYAEVEFHIDQIAKEMIENDDKRR